MSMDLAELKLKLSEPIAEPEVVVRLVRSYWKDKSGLHMKTSLKYLKRKCKGFNFIEDDAYQVGAEDVVHVITNLETSPDGIYRLITCNECRDWESGYIESWDYELVPYEGE